MKKEHTRRPARKMKPVFLVFCEGETEEAYIHFLRQKYRLPIKVIPRITGLSISPGIIKRYIQGEQIGPGDRITSFLMYDLDTEGIATKLSLCTESVSIASNPCVELWFLLHNCEQKNTISTHNCIETLKKTTPDWVYYKKGMLSEKQKQILWANVGLASARAKELPDGQNPSSLIYRLIAVMNRFKC